MHGLWSRTVSYGEITMRLTIMLTILGASLCWADDAKDDAVKKEMEKLQGTWKVVKAVKRGEAAPEDELKKMQVVITGDKLTVKDGTHNETTPFAIAPTRQPATIDLTVEKAKLTIQGIYELDKGVLKICVGLDGKKRPTEFTSTENSGTILLVLEREKK
jgi:uncharacterized protein (TIGR03067 family)